MTDDLEPRLRAGLRLRADDIAALTADTDTLTETRRARDAGARLTGALLAGVAVLVLLAVGVAAAWPSLWGRGGRVAVPAPLATGTGAPPTGAGSPTVRVSPTPSDVPTPSDIPTLAELAGNWIVVSASGTPQALLTDRPVGLRFGDPADGWLGVETGCTYLSTSNLRINGGRLVAERYSATANGCIGPSSAQQAWVSDLLTASPTVRVSGDRLTLGGKEMTVIARRVFPLPAELAGRWTVTDPRRGRHP